MRMFQRLCKRPSMNKWTLLVRKWMDGKRLCSLRRMIMLDVRDSRGVTFLVMRIKRRYCALVMPLSSNIASLWIKTWDLILLDPSTHRNYIRHCSVQILMGWFFIRSSVQVEMRFSCSIVEWVCLDSFWIRIRNWHKIKVQSLRMMYSQIYLKQNSGF